MFEKLFSRFRGASEMHRAFVPSGLRVYAVGDIHGCANELDKLHGMIAQNAQIGAPEQLLLIYLGDYIDRGPQSAGVLERLCGPALPGFSRIFLKGNHEEMLERFLASPEAGAAWRHVGGFETLLSYGVDDSGMLSSSEFAGLAAELNERMPETHRAFLKNLVTHAVVGDYFFCHAGVNPRYSLDVQSPRDLLWIRDDFLRSKRNFGKIIVHGHSPVDQPEVKSNRINVDTGVYATKRLTAVVLEGGEFRFIST